MSRKRHDVLDNLADQAKSERSLYLAGLLRSFLAFAPRWLATSLGQVSAAVRPESYAPRRH
jgi:hypothetical protein